MKNKIALLHSTYIGLCLCVLTISCQGKSDKTATTSPPEYKVLALKTQNVELYNEFPATLEGIENIEIRPKIEGFIEKVMVDEGEKVTKGQLLFILDAPQYQQDYLSAKAAVSSARAAVSTSEVEVEKAKPLVEREIISAFELTSAKNTLLASKASLEQALTALNIAETNKSYTRVTAPVSGLIGTLPYKLGSLVSSTTTDPLTTVSNVDSIYAYFSINEKTQLNFFRNSKSKNSQEQIQNIPAVSLLLADNSLFNEKGKIQTVSGQVDEETGSLNVRAVFNNKEGMLRTGNSATIRIPNTITNAIIIPQSATYEIQGQIYVYTLNKENKVASKKIEVTPTASGLAYVVTEGLKENDKLIIEGINGLNEGQEVQPITVAATTISALQADNPEVKK